MNANARLSSACEVLRKRIPINPVECLPSWPKPVHCFDADHRERKAGNERCDEVSYPENAAAKQSVKQLKDGNLQDISQ